MSKAKRVVVVTHHYHYESGDVIAVFKRHKHAVKYVRNLLGGQSYNEKNRDDGVIDFDLTNCDQSYEIKCFEVDQGEKNV
jgi:hypothetical protein